MITIVTSEHRANGPARASSRRRRQTAAALARRHAVFLAVAGAGLALRIAVTLAYHPAFINPDSPSYLDAARALVPDPLRPLGYGAFLRVVIDIGGFGAVAVVQHGMGLLLCVLLYAPAVRLGVPPWLAALGSAPAALDGYELSLEHYVLSETLFDLLVVAACAALLWRRRPPPALAAAAGALLAAAALTRAVGFAVLVPALIAVLAAAPRRPLPALALIAAFCLPLAGYAAWYHHVHGRYALTGDGGLFLYARVAPIADCAHDGIPAPERALCPPGGPRLSVTRYRWSKASSPLFRVPAGRRTALAGDFARRVIRHQPVDYVRTVAADAAHAFAVAPGPEHNDRPDRWRFARTFPIERGTTAMLHRYGEGRGTVRPRLAAALRSYQGVASIPGPLLAVCLAVAALAVAGAGRARRSGLRTATFLLAGMALVIFAGAVATNEYTWRYRLPLVILAPPAAALGIAALTRTERHGRP
jgi:4-amino-4-deoxy-L-arabinose transferase-like glycosyltransferase